MVCVCVCVDVFRVYVWTDDHGRKLKCSAPLYFDYAMSYIQELLTDEDVFPTKAGNDTGAPSAGSQLQLLPRDIFFFLFLHFCSLFPGSTFPTGFVFLVQKVFLLFFRTLAHVYWSHYRETLALGLHPHLNTLFSHLTLFCRQHGLLEAEETEPLQDLIAALGEQG